MKYVFIILLFISTAVSAQVVQETNDSRASRRVIVKNGLLLPKVCNPTTALPDLLNYSYNQGAIVFDSCNNKIKWWNGSFWDSTGAGGTGDYVDTIYRKPGQDSIFFTINGGAERAIKDSTGAGGGGIPIDSVTIQRYGFGSEVFGLRSFNAGGLTSAAQSVGSSASANRYDSLNMMIGYLTGRDATTGYGNTYMGNRIALRGTTAFNNIGIGVRALGGNGAADFTGNNNVALGFTALNAITTGVNNVAIGQRALFPTTTGGENIAIGNDALQNNSTGGRSVAVGVRALRNASATGSPYNVAIGYDALTGSTSGVNNTAIGARTMSLAAVTGQGNVGVGYFNMTALTSGSANISIGDQTGNGITTGNRNIIIGSSGGLNHGNGTDRIIFGSYSGYGAYTPGDLTTAIGNYAGAKNTGKGTYIGAYAGANENNVLPATTTTNTTAIGEKAGTNRTGTGNTFIGAESGRPTGAFPNSTVHISGNNNVFIGFQAANSDSGSNNIVIGYNVRNPTAGNSNQLSIGSNAVRYYISQLNGTLRQHVFNGTSTDVSTFTASAALEVTGTTGAVLFPRLTTTQRDALTATNGMVIYNTTTDKLQVYAAAAWVDLH